MSTLARTAIDCLDRVLGPLVMGWQRHHGGGTVLLYHRVSPEPDPAFEPLSPELFAAHCELIRSHFEVLPLGELLERYFQGKSLAGCCAITFDDGYQDFLEHAYPILRACALPVTHFLIADCVLSGRPTWNLRLRRVLRHRGDPDAADQRVHSRLAEQLKEALGKMAAGERYAWLEVQEQGCRSLPPEPAMLRAADLARCDPDLVEWGSHTLSHANLAECRGEALRRELRESRRLLEEVTGSPIRYVSYPNNSYSREAMQAARECGYACGFAVDQRQAFPQSDRYAFPRFNVGYMPPGMLRMELGGALTSLRRVSAALTWRSA